MDDSCENPNTMPIEKALKELNAQKELRSSRMTLVSNGLRYPVENKSPSEIDKILEKRDKTNYKVVVRH